MASLDSLPPDQRAVLQLVLQRGRSYDDIAKLLSIDRAAVRQRALSAFDAIGPQTRVDADRRALITDYLLGQLPDAVATDTRDRLATSASERAWARVLASELQPLAGGSLPDIPADGGQAPAAAPAPAGAPAPATAPTESPAATPAAPPDASQTVGAAAAGATGTPTAESEKPPRRIPPAYGAPSPSRGDGGRPRSLVGGAILLAVIVIAIIVVVVILATGGSSKKTPVASTPATTSTPGSTSTPTGTTPTTPTTSTTTTKPIAQINLVSPTHSKTTGGFADVVRQGTQEGIVIAAQGLPPNTKHDAYAVWLSNPGGNSVLLGFVNPPVGKNGRLETVGKLPPNAASYKTVLVTIETVQKPKGPGTIVLEGQPPAGKQF
jgi:hypothetical protein